LFRVHLSQPLVALDAHAALYFLEQPVECFLEFDDPPFLLPALYIRPFRDQAVQHLRGLPDLGMIAAGKEITIEITHPQVSVLQAL